MGVQDECRPPQATCQPKPHHNYSQKAGILYIVQYCMILYICKAACSPQKQTFGWDLVGLWSSGAENKHLGCGSMPVCCSHKGWDVLDGFDEGELLALGHMGHSTGCTGISLHLSFSFLGCNEHHKQVWNIASPFLSCFFPHKPCLKVTARSPDARERHQGRPASRSGSSFLVKSIITNSFPSRKLLQMSNETRTLEVIYF